MKTNGKLTKIVAGTLASSIFASSCSEGFVEKEEFLKSEQKGSEDVNNALISMNVETNPEFAKYVDFLGKLSSEIISNPEVAKKFVKQPELYLKKFGYNESVNLDDPIMRIVIALGDEEILNTIKNNDVDTFLSLLEKKNLLSNNEMEDANVQIYKSVRLLNNSNNGIAKSLLKTQIQRDKALVALVAVAVIAVAAMAVSVVTFFWTVGRNANIQNLYANEPVLGVWNMKSGGTTDFYVVDKYLETKLQGVVDFVRRNNPNFFENVMSEEEFKQNVKLNLIKNQ